MSVLAKSRYDHLHSAVTPTDGVTEEAAKAQILVVDDDPAMQRAVKTILSRQGHHVVVAGSAEDALAVLSEANFDVVMLDVQMTGMSGLSTPNPEK